MTCPHTTCPYIEGDAACRDDCPACVVEPEAEYHNRRECAAEGSGEPVERRVECAVTSMIEWRRELEAA